MSAMKRHTVLQGSYYVSSDPDLMITTLLGSCVAACAYDRAAGVGGMNHFLLPDGNGKAAAGRDRVYGSYLMEVLLNDLFKQGADRSRMEVKLFGGARLFDTRYNPGSRNAEFITRFMRDEGYSVVASSLGGERGRRIEFNPTTGLTRQKFMSEPVKEEQPVAAPKAQDHGDLELF